MWATHQLTVSDWGGRPHSRAGSTRMHPTGGSEFRGAPPPALMGAALTSAGAAPRVQSRSPSVQMQQAWSADADTAAAPHIPRPVSVSPPSPRSPRSPPSPRSPQSPPAMRPPTSPVGGHSRPGSPEGTARQASSRPATSSSPTRGARGGGGMRSWVQSHLGVAGTLSYKEWTNPDKVFDLIDRDRSGQVSKSELRGFFEGSPLDLEKQNELFDMLDADGSGEVSREEWRHGFYQAGFDGTAVVGQSIEGLSVLLNLVSAPRLTSYGGASIRAFDDLSNGRPACRIARAEERGITLSQLRTLWEHVQCRCVPEGWMDVHGAPLTPERVDLYDVLRYVVKPATRAATCSYVERVAVRPQLPSWVVVHWWGQPLAEVVACLEAHTRDRGVSDAAGSYWLAAFALNQHQQGGVFDDAAWQAMQQATHLSCGTVAVVDREGSAFKRVCLLYELLAAVRCNQASGGRASAHKLDIYVYMPHIDRKRCVSAAIGLTDGFAMSDFAQSETNKMRRESVFPLALIETALRLRVQDGHAATEADKRRILRTLTHSFHVERERASLHRRVAAAGAGAADEHEGVDVEKDDSEDPLQPANQTLHARIALAALRVVIDAQHSPRGRRSGSPSSIGSPQSGSPPGSPEAGGGRPGGALGPLSSLHAASSRPLLEGCLEALSLGRLAVIQLSLSNCAAFDATTAGALARALPPALERLVLYYHDVEPVAADCFVEGLSQALGFGRLPTMRHVGLFSNMFSDTAGYALSNALRTAPKTLRSLDFGSPVPFSYPRIADAIVSIRSPLTLSYYGEERMSGTGLNVSGMGLSTCDVILLIATASRGVPEKLRALDLSRNPLQNAAITVLVKAIAADSLPHLHYVDLSGIPPANCSNRGEVMDAMRDRAERAVAATRISAAADGRESPHGLTLMRYQYSPHHQFKIVPADGMVVDWDDD